MIAAFRVEVDDERLKIISQNLVTKPYFFSDENRNYDYAWRYIFDVVCGGDLEFFHIDSETGLQGIMAVTDVIPGHKAHLIMYLWDYDVFNDDGLLGELRSFLEIQMQKYALHRLSYETADAELAKRLEDLGFKVEGRQKYAFMKDGKMITNFLLRKIKEVQ